MSAVRRPFLSRRLVARALSAHSALGVALAAFLFITCLSGTITVVAQELQRWEQPAAPEMSRIEPAALQHAAQTVLAGRASEHFFIQLPTDEMPRVVITTDHGAVLVDEEGGIAGEEAHPWTQFVLDLHYYLHLPQTVGLTVVGVLGVVLLALAVTGLFGHPRIFRDAFAFRFGRSARLSQADLHNRVGVWTSPFHVSIALTGAVLGLASFAALAIGELDMGGDTEAVFAPVFGDEPAHDDRPAPLADIATAMRHMERVHPELVPTYVIMHEPKTAGQHLQILAEHPNRLVFGEYYNFDSSGRFVGTVGMADGAAGQQLAASMYRLHFGSFGGLPVKIAYVLLGGALLWIVSTGMNIYFLRRRERAKALPRLEGAWTAVIWGSALALALTMLGSLSGLLGAGALPSAFWLVLAGLVIIGAAVQDPVALGRTFRFATGLLLIAAAVLHATSNAAEPFSPAALGILLVQTALGLLLIFWTRMLGAPALAAPVRPPHGQIGHPQPEAAE